MLALGQFDGHRSAVCQPDTLRPGPAAQLLGPTAQDRGTRAPPLGDQDSYSLGTTGFVRRQRGVVQERQEGFEGNPTKGLA